MVSMCFLNPFKFKLFAIDYINLTAQNTLKVLYTWIFDVVIIILPFLPDLVLLRIIIQSIQSCQIIQ